MYLNISVTILQPWYANEAVIQGLPYEVTKYFQLLKKLGLMFGYLLEPEICFVICPLATEESFRPIFAGADLPVQFY